MAGLATAISGAAGSSRMAVGVVPASKAVPVARAGAAALAAAGAGADAALFAAAEPGAAGTSGCDYGARLCLLSKCLPQGPGVTDPPYQVIHLSKSSTILGRSPTCDVTFDAPSAPTMISRAHACIERIPEGSDGSVRWRITDQKSLNGILVNDQPVKPSRFLQAGDVVCFGRKQLRPELEFVFEVAEQGRDQRLTVDGRPAWAAQVDRPTKAARTMLWNEGQGTAGAEAVASLDTAAALGAQAAREDLQELLKKLEAEKLELEQSRKELEERKQREQGELDRRRQEIEQEGKKQAERVAKEAAERATKEAGQTSIGIKDLESELFCAICQDWLVQTVTLDCVHNFCFKCIDTWLQKKTFDCPICRKEVCREPQRSRVLDGLVEKSINKLPSDKDRDEFKRRLKEAEALHAKRKREHDELSKSVDAALQQGKNFFQVDKNWNKKELKQFDEGVKNYIGGAREAYCKLVGLTRQWIMKATENQLNQALRNLRLPKFVGRDEEYNRQRLLIYLTYG